MTGQKRHGPPIKPRLDPQGRRLGLYFVVFDYTRPHYACAAISKTLRTASVWALNEAGARAKILELLPGQVKIRSVKRPAWTCMFD